MNQQIIEVTGQNFEQEVLKSDRPVLVDFWAAWCGPCRAMSPILDELAHQYGDQVKFTKCNVDDNSSTAAQYRILSIPTLILFVDGKPEKTLIGAMQKRKLTDELQPWLTAAV